MAAPLRILALARAAALAAVPVTRSVARSVVGLVAVLAAVLVLLGGCGDGRLAGSGSVTTNGFTGRVLKDGLPAAGVRVTLYPAAWDPTREQALPDPLRDTTDAAGAYAFAKVKAGEYTLLAQAGDGTAALVASLTLHGGEDTVVAVLDATLTKTGSIAVGLPGVATQPGGYLYLPGTDRFAAVDSAALSAGRAVLAEVPPGDYDVLYYRASGSDSVRDVVPDTVHVVPGGAPAVKPFALWKRAWRVTVDASSAGFDLAEDLAGFPLLVRLDAGNFDFAAAAAEGADVRVTRLDGATLVPFEIESWDAAARRASLWVRVDTLRKGDAGQGFLIFAGREGAATVSSGAGVFAAASGFEGVWHLGESPSAGRSAFRDRTSHGRHGSPASGLNDSSRAAGVIGGGVLFDGRNDHIELPASRDLLGAAGRDLTVSAWIRHGAVSTDRDSIRHRLVSFKEDSLGASSLAFGITDKGTLAHYSRGADTLQNWGTALMPDSLYHVAMTFAGGTLVGYVNGREDFRTTGLVLGASGAAPAMVGAHQGGDRLFRGLIDELRCESVARSASWVHLAYLSQRPGAMVRIEAIR